MEKVYKFENESDLLGSLLQNEVLKNENVTYCGYNKDHPNIDIIQLKIISKDTEIDTDVILKDSIKNLINYFEELLKNC